MNCGYRQLNYELSRHYKPPEQVLFSAISALQSIPGYEDTVAELSNKLENLFKPIVPSKGIITLGSLTYYPSGVVNNSDKEWITLSSWTYSPTPKKQQKSKPKQKYKVNECKKLLAQTCGLFSAQLLIKENARIVPQEKFNAFADGLKKIDILNIGHINNSNVLNIDVHGIFNDMMRFIDSFMIIPVSSSSRGRYSDYIVTDYLLSDDALEDIAKIYISGNTYWVARAMGEYIEKIDPKKTIPLEEEIFLLATTINASGRFSPDDFGIFEEQSTPNYKGERYSKIVGYDISKICESDMYKYAIKLYGLLMNTQTEQLKQIALKFGMIKEDYIPLALQPESDISNEDIEH